MRIGLLIWGSLDRLTGGFLYDQMLVEHLRRQGHEVSVVSLPMRSYSRAVLDNFSPRLLARLRDSAFDLLLQDELAHPSCVWLNRRLRRTARVPIVPIVHLLRVSQEWPAWQRPLYRRVERDYLATADGLILVNPQLRDRIARLTGAERPSVVARPAGDHVAGTITPERILVRAREPGPLRILFVGNLTPLKNLHLVIDALARLTPGDWRLDVIGNLEADRAYTYRLRRQIGLNGRITLLGELPRGEVVTHLERSHVLAMPSAPESYSIVYLEAMSHGLPVIASTASDSAAMVEPGGNGFVVAPGDAEALAGHLRLLMNDRDRLARMGLAARRFYEAHPTWEQSMEQAHQFLLGIQSR